MTAVSRSGIEFEFEYEDGTRGTAKKILLATGLVDELRRLQGSMSFTGFQSTTVYTATASNTKTGLSRRMAKGTRALILQS